MKKSFLVSNVVWLIICFAISGLAGWVTQVHIHPWFTELQKPPFNPPSWLFGPVWTVLYIMIALAAARIWRVRKTHPILVTVFIIQLAFNFAWSFLFFGHENTLWGLIDISLLWLSLFACLLMAYVSERIAGYLLTPYFLWVSFACVLNVSLWLLN